MEFATADLDPYPDLAYDWAVEDARSGRPNILLDGDKTAHQGGKGPRSSGH
jgi:hypothetical protein